MFSDYQWYARGNLNGWNPNNKIRISSQRTGLVNLWAIDYGSKSMVAFSFPKCYCTGVDAGERHRPCNLSHPCFQKFKLSHRVGHNYGILINYNSTQKKTCRTGAKKTCRSLPSDFRRSPASTPVYYLTSEWKIFKNLNENLFKILNLTQAKFIFVFPKSRRSSQFFSYDQFPAINCCLKFLLQK